MKEFKDKVVFEHYPNQPLYVSYEDEDMLLFLNHRGRFYEIKRSDTREMIWKDCILYSISIEAVRVGKLEVGIDPPLTKVDLSCIPSEALIKLLFDERDKYEEERRRYEDR